MQKHISLLYTDGMSVGKSNSSILDAVYNLNIDRMARHACDNKKLTDYFLSVLCAPAKSPETAIYRSEILRDFIENEELLAGLMQLFRSYDNLRAETEEMTKEIFRYGVPASEIGMLDCTYEELYINAHFARNVIAYFSEIYDLFSGHDVRSRGLEEMKSFCNSMKESKCIEEIEKAAERFRSESTEGYRFTVECSLDEAMEAYRCTVSDIADASKQEKKGFKAIFKKRPEVPTEVDIGSSASDNACSAVTMALSDLSSLFSDIALEIYAVFFGIGEELGFYYVACEIAKKLKKAGMTYVFPEVLPKEDDVLTASGIYDMLLLTEGKDFDSIVPNDISVDKNGILAMGDNNCGKTSFLRAVGSAVLFAQSGMFVCADSMRVSMRTGIFSHFSSAEKDFSSGDAAGRFEGEVADIAKIVDELTPYSLVLLNESFQTTAYREGAEGMKAILDVLPNINVKYIFVTHMKAIFSLIDEDEVTVLKADKFKLLPWGK